jgi:hypothetical protein
MHVILNELKGNGLKGDLVDFMWVELPLICGGLAEKSNTTSYVDEVQDMLLIDTRRMCFVTSPWMAP